MTMRVDWKKIKHMMIERGIRSDAELARGAGVHPNTIGKNDGFRSDTVDRIAEYLGCNPLDLIAVDAPTPAPTSAAATLRAQQRDKLNATIGSVTSEPDSKPDSARAKDRQFFRPTQPEDANA